MEINVLRFNSAKDHTNSIIHIDGVFECLGLEDEYRAVKKYGETRIPEGRYKIEFRKEGGFHNRYKDRFGDFHKGMLQVMDVPNFEYILIHTGNDDKDTAGCLLVGSTFDGNKPNWIGQSTMSYRKLYSKVSQAIINGEEVFINYINLG